MKFGGRTAAAIIEFPGNKILLVQRGTVVFKGYWALPGGRVDNEETVEQTVLREIKEETGLDIKIVRKIGDYNERGIEDGIEYDYYPTCFHVKPISKKIEKQEEEIKQIKLFDIEELPKKLAFEHSRMIKDYIKLRKITKLNDKIRNCKKCRLHKTRINTVPGEGPQDANIMICGQAPGRNEDKKGMPFIGMAGRCLDKLLDLIRLERKRTFITSSIKCFPPNNRTPKSDELKACKPYLNEQIKIIEPKIIVALGNIAIQIIMDKKFRITQIHGKLKNKNGLLIFPTFHPAAAIRFPETKLLMEKDFTKLKKILLKL